MAKRPNTMETVVFVLELLRRIPKRQKVTSAQLQEQLSEIGIDRDIRTIQRHLDMLSSRFPIERDERCKPYGYSWIEDAEGISLPALTEQESLLLTLAYTYLKNLLPYELISSMDSFFKIAKYNIITNPTHPGSQWLNKVRIVSPNQPLLPPDIDISVFRNVSRALYANKWLKINYKNAKNQQKEIKVMPLGLVQQGPRLYLVCRFDGYTNERSLALHRMLKVDVSTIGFEPPPEFDLQQYDEDGRFGFGEGQKIRLSFKINKPAGDHLLETPLSTDQIVNEHDTYYQITATVVDSAQLTWWLRGFGEDVYDIERKLL